MFVLSLGLFPLSAFAYNFLYIHPTTGEPLHWEPGTTIHYYVDPGPLGRLTNEQARTLLRAAMDIWENASPYADVPHFEYAGLLPEDVNGSNYRNYVSKIVCYKESSPTCNTQTQTDQKTVILLDQDDSILSALCGGVSCTGVGLPNVFSDTSNNPGSITGGFIVISGSALNVPPPAGQSINSLTGLFVHELGHLLGLAHTSVNQEPYILGETGFDRYMPTMFFSIVPGSIGYTEKTSVTLNPDDIAGITTLYPTTTAATNLGTIEGKIEKADGIRNPLLNVIARNINDPLCEAYSFLSGRSCYFSPSQCVDVRTNPELGPNSGFILSSISPGTYTVEVEEIADENIALNYTPLLVSTSIYGDAEFWNSDDQASEPNTLSSTITLAAGETRSNIDIILNRNTVTTDRIKYIPLSTFTPGPATRCPENPPVDYAALIGISETGGSGGTEIGGSNGGGGSGGSSDPDSSSGCSLMK